MGGIYKMHGELGNTYKISVRKSDRQRPPGYLGTDGRVILKWILKK
jgi:hypothetical protein